MIDTCGLPMKFEFYVYEGGPTYIFDFNHVKHGMPLLYQTGEKESDGTYAWPPSEIMANIEDGSWIICNVFNDPCVEVDVEDLL